MANKEELKTMIKCFRIHELQMLLSFAGRSKKGRKQELQDRALTLLKLQSEPLSFKIRQLYNRMHSNGLQFTDSEVPRSSAPNQTDDDEKDDDSISIVDDIECSGKGQTCSNRTSRESEKFQNRSDSSLHLSLNPLYYPDHPDVKLKKLPFYKVLFEILKPSSLVPKDCNFQQKNSFIFYLTPDQVAAICLSANNIQPGVHQECTVQGQLRFCLLETTSKQDDCFPAGLVVRVNNKFCNIQELSGRRKKDIYMKEISPPINITPFLKITSTEANKIEVQWNTEYGLAYILAAYVVQKKSSEDLLGRLLAKAVRPAESTRRMIRDKLNEEADGEILTTSLRVSLMCPLGKMRLKSPCRASTCQHLQCFDASLFLQMNERKPTWTCPVCDNSAEYDKLVIDGYFLEILKSDLLSPHVNEIELQSDGSWSSIVIKTERDRDEENGGSGDHEDNAVKIEPDVIVDVVGPETVDRSPSKEGSGEHGGNGSCGSSSAGRKATMGSGGKRKIDEIDLTISDSDDEPLIWYKRRESSKNQTDRSTASNRSSPSVINIDDDDDSDSSDSLALMITSAMSPSRTPTPAPTPTPTIVPDDFPGDDPGLKEEEEEDEGDATRVKGPDNIMWFTESPVFF